MIIYLIDKTTFTCEEIEFCMDGDVLAYSSKEGYRKIKTEDILKVFPVHG